MSNKPLKISEQAAVQMPMKTVASLIALVAIGTWAFFGVQETLNKHSTQLELMKMCGKVNNNPTIVRNPNFALLVSKCSGIIIPENKKPEGSHWDDLKDQYKKDNPEIKLMGDKFIGPNEQ